MLGSDFNKNYILLSEVIMDYYYFLHNFITGAPYSDVPLEHTAAWLIGQIDFAYKAELISYVEANKLTYLVKKCYLEWLIDSCAFNDVNVEIIVSPNEKTFR